MLSRLAVPRALRSGHLWLRQGLAGAIDRGGKTGVAARRVVELLEPHVAREEEFALPPLSLLPVLARGGTVSDEAGALAMTDRLRAEMSRMIGEHDEIAVALHALIVAAQSEGHPGIADLAKELVHYAETEEEVLYPAALLVGELLKSRRA